jgi:hypothetical protein
MRPAASPPLDSLTTSHVEHVRIEFERDVGLDGAFQCSTTATYSTVLREN